MFDARRRWKRKGGNIILKEIATSEDSTTLFKYSKITQYKNEREIKILQGYTRYHKRSHQWASGRKGETIDRVWWFWYGILVKK